MSVSIPVRRGGEIVAYALVSDEDAERVSAARWSMNGADRPYGCPPGSRTTAMHRFICGLTPGGGSHVHHKNGDPLDNRRANLLVLSSAADHARIHRPLVPYRRLAHAVGVAARLSIRASRHDLVRYRRGCRCEECKAANRAYNFSLRGRTPPRHGDSGYMNYGCRCAVCKAENSQAQRRKRERRAERQAA